MQAFVVGLFAIACVAGCSKSDKAPSADKADKIITDVSTGNVSPSHAKPDPDAAWRNINRAEYTSGIAVCDALVEKAATCRTLPAAVHGSLLGVASAATRSKGMAQSVKDAFAQQCIDEAQRQEAAIKAAGC